ncbi:MAG: OprO/OprP family phosphate-selective porin [Phycisphaerales bacterium]|nr:OprO/OprP family phosphate-selective porin [Phycisphaerales bacterium]
MQGRTLTVLLASTLLAHPIMAGGPEETTRDLVQSEIDALRTEIQDYRSSLDALVLDEERVAGIRALVTDTLADAAGRTSLQQADNKTFPSKWNSIETRDGNFSLNLSMYTQIDWILNHTSSGGSAWGMETRRCRLTFTGHVIDPSWNYYVRLQFSPDGQSNSEAAYIEKDLGDGWALQAGKIFAMFSLEEDISNDEELGADLSFVAGQFDAQIVNGACLNYQDDTFRFWLTYCNGARETDIDPLRNNQQGVMFRGEYKVFGNWGDLYDFNPHPDSTDPGVLVGFGSVYNWGDYNPLPPSVAVDGPETYLTADLTWQMPGFSMMGCGYYQDIPNYVQNPNEPGSYGGTRWAAVAQMTGFVSPVLQFYGRAEWGTITTGNQPDVRVFTVGTSYYPYKTKALKFTAEFIYTMGSTVNWQLDGNSGFLNTDENQAIFRTQMQFSF